MGRNSKSTLPVPESHSLHGQVFKLYYDDTLQSYFRRLDYSPDGDLIAVPTGLIENEQNGVVNHANVAYIYKRSQMKSPVCMLQCGDSPSLIVSWNPIRFQLREDGPKPLIQFPSPIRFVLAVGTRTSVLLYDTQQTTPFAVISNIHYTRLTDLTWSVDGRTLVVSSTDGYCSIIKFSEDELGLPVKVDKIEDVEMTDALNDKENISDNNAKGVSKPDEPFAKGNTDEANFNKTPKSKTLTPSRKKKGSTQNLEKTEEKSVIMIDEIAMEPWSQDGSLLENKNSSHTETSNEMVIDEPTEDIRMVYEETASENSAVGKGSENKKGILSTKADDAPKQMPKTPRRVSFITLSSPKSKKKS